MSVFFRLFSFLFVAVVFIGCENNETVKFETADHSVIIENPRIRVANKGGNSALYLDLSLMSDKLKSDKLISAMTPVCEIVELHNTVTEEIDGVKVKKMRPVQFIKIEKGAKTVLKPGGMHIMLLKLKRDLHVNDSVPVTLFFENAGKIIIEAEVENINGGCSNRRSVRPV